MHTMCYGVYSFPWRVHANFNPFFDTNTFSIRQLPTNREFALAEDTVSFIFYLNTNTIANNVTQ